MPVRLVTNSTTFYDLERATSVNFAVHQAGQNGYRYFCPRQKCGQLNLLSGNMRFINIFVRITPNVGSETV